jgi:hypothetical protein
MYIFMFWSLRTSRFQKYLSLFQFIHNFLSIWNLGAHNFPVRLADRKIPPGFPLQFLGFAQDAWAVGIAAQSPEQAKRATSPCASCGISASIPCAPGGQQTKRPVSHLR